MSANNGGPAFPTEAYDLERQTMVREEGMTLRDYFAAKAMQALISDELTVSESKVAAWAYVQADAMLEARK